MLAQIVRRLIQIELNVQYAYPICILDLANAVEHDVRSVRLTRIVCAAVPLRHAIECIGESVRPPCARFRGNKCALALILLVGGEGDPSGIFCRSFPVYSIYQGPKVARFRDRIKTAVRDS